MFQSEYGAALEALRNMRIVEQRQTVWLRGECARSSVAANVSRDWIGKTVDQVSNEIELMPAARAACNGLRGLIERLESVNQ